MNALAVGLWVLPALICSPFSNVQTLQSQLVYFGMGGLGFALYTAMVCPVVEVAVAYLFAILVEPRNSVEPLAAIFSFLAPPRGSVDPRAHWCYVLHSYSICLIPTASVVSSSMMTSRMGGSAPAMFTLVGLLLSRAFWWAALTIHFLIRARSKPGAVLAAMLVPVVTVIAIAIGFVFGLALGALATVIS